MRMLYVRNYTDLRKKLHHTRGLAHSPRMCAVGMQPAAARLDARRARLARLLSRLPRRRRAHAALLPDLQIVQHLVAAAA